METIQTRRSGLLATATAAVLGIAGLLSGTLAVAWLIGAQNLSRVAAERIVQAVALGGWAVAIVGALVSAGLAGIIIASTRAFLMRFGAGAAIR